MKRSQSFQINTTAEHYLNCGSRIRPANPFVQGTPEWHRFEVSSQAMHNQISKHGAWPDKETFSNTEVSFITIKKTFKELYLKDNILKLENLHYKTVARNITVAVYKK